MKVEINMRLPGLNEYINECRKNKLAGAEMKQRVEDEIALYTNKLLEIKKPVKINFTWVEENQKRDLDNICFAKKFILDALVKTGKLSNDNRKSVTGFTDTFRYDTESKVILEIIEI